jgi:hypothetical protein
LHLGVDFIDKGIPLLGFVSGVEQAEVFKFILS